MDQRNSAFQLKYNEYKSILEELQQKVIELGHDSDEHHVVLKTLNGTDEERKCYRMVGSALVESDVKTTISVLETKSKKLDETVSMMKSELVKTAQEFEKWKKDNKIQVVKQ
ncbi:GIM4 (YEL003W) [Zygosaccharomyces parabailii]|uniref:ZYBA0S12-03114g1_1 n=1 Tax=Zygosaccharomyces bailii (strain CLIB 213 / ATCC 58445 / CBS 680 / BCRC 21525 / NBRC 1098 / NCYC 1416 / NRRL Y-2227) TaxID=1333698 RepID=A0A8J2TB27_ZYGB2|nr:GIM4 (YEL003W) [Zygosaccharomyces parabailii]CDF91620.1 ZYBA0S12-03114g1_1 [Zygosaccharomyces bailii CLIB 213]CDH17273.1 probable Prefoldin subunit 2 [Zygosaccharomyces bailii ISA1307]SJM86356.1 probable Prefoldin subunit 2 [Zygosaccharomyces bailii]